jgi:predicted nucleic acid-binding protein
MSIEKIIVNASPLICLFKAELEYLLAKIWQEVIVPAAVWDEVLNGPRTDRAATFLKAAPWAKRIEVPSIHPSITGWDLGRGESEVLTFALLNKSFRAIIDDAEARRCARTLGIRTFGTGGLLVLAKRRGLITSVSEKVESMKISGLWLSEDVIEILKRQAGE